ncbi:MAG: PTS sugar transporter subunit IIA [Spirochaetaceae bacterium]|nr:MAG: PTS sugar transporter subunit IIA [Spirochaetaceae bacterium]
MGLFTSFRPECIQIGSAARNKQEVLAELARLAKKSRVLGKVSEKRILDALQQRERVGTTGFGDGIAIPHCSLEDIDEFVVGLLIAPEGADFESLDRKKTTTFFFIIGPVSQRNRHIQLLSAISKVLKNPDVIERFLEAFDEKRVGQIVEELFRLVDIGVAPGLQKGRCLFHVFVQREEYFEDILQLLSAAVAGSIAVIETNAAGYYLHRIPLFAAYWSESQKGFCRLILAVVDKDLCNDVIRRIHTVVEDIEKSPGVLISVQELFYSSGSLEF